jgi:hypothetical protein
MGAAPIQESGDIDWAAAPGHHWLGRQLWDGLACVRDANGRVVQEAVLASVIRDWAAQARCFS